MSRLRRFPGPRRPDPGENPTTRNATASLRRDLIAVEAATLAALYSDGQIGEATRRLQHSLDLEETSLFER